MHIANLSKADGTVRSTANGYGICLPKRFRRGVAVAWLLFAYACLGAMPALADEADGALERIPKSVKRVSEKNARQNKKPEHCSDPNRSENALDIAARRLPLERLRFDIAAQPLSRALEAFSMRTGLQVLYESGIVEDKTSQAVIGTYSSSGALVRLLSGTGLMIRYTAQRDFVLVREAAMVDAAAMEFSGEGDENAALILGTATAAGTGLYRLYDLVIQKEVRQALQQDRRTRSGDYRLRIALWLSPNGAVSRTDFLNYAGEPDYEPAIRDVLSHLNLSKAPPNSMPQPVRLTIFVQSP